MDNQIPFPPNTWSKDPSVASQVGQEFIYKGLKLLLVKAGAALTTPAGQFVKWLDPAQETCTVAAKAALTAANNDPGCIAGLVPRGVSTVTSNAYLYVIRGGLEVDGSLLSVAVFSSAQIATTYLNVVALSCGVCGIQQISSTVQQGRALARLRQTTSSSLWVDQATSAWNARVEVTL